MLIEILRLPGLESSLHNKEKEDLMYDCMMSELLTIVNGDFNVASNWNKIRESTNDKSNCDGKNTFKNILAWKLLTKSLKI